mmetsp:Transcript_19110/g.38978  ORF Transcript_19110/g.38978 Transcript_19110/m.38978 type:complete len:108 (-) Transcript_19110:150-473(-)
MLIFSPMKRTTVEEALAHPYLASLHDPSDEPLAHAEFSFDFERIPLNKQVLRELLTNEMMAFHPNWDGGRSDSVPTSSELDEGNEWQAGAPQSQNQPFDEAEQMQFD